MRVAEQLLRFGLVGALATALHYVLLIALVQLAGWSALAASSLGFSLSALLNYALNRRFTFRSRRAHGEALPRFALVAASGLALNALLLAALIEVGAHYLIAQVLATALVLLWNFSLNHRWSFREPSARAPARLR
ncbi:MAG: GtrA family protein [Chromatiaceae bacterium]|nr:GtrA family protein [Chromatiaceae bacterium]